MTVAGNISLFSHDTRWAEPAGNVANVAHITKEGLLPDALSQLLGEDVKLAPIDLIMWQVWILRAFIEEGEPPFPNTANAVEVRYSCVELQFNRFIFHECVRRCEIGKPYSKLYRMLACSQMQLIASMSTLSSVPSTINVGKAAVKRFSRLQTFDCTAHPCRAQVLRSVGGE